MLSLTGIRLKGDRDGSRWVFRRFDETDVAETIDALKRTRDDATKSKESALAYLQKLGVVDKTGKLSKRYRTSKIKNAA